MQHTECVLGLILGSKMRKAQVKDCFFTKAKKILKLTFLSKTNVTKRVYFL